MDKRKQPHSEERRRKNSEGHKGLKFSDAHRRKLSEWAKRRPRKPHTEAHKEYMRNILRGRGKGRKLPIETRRKISATLKRRVAEGRHNKWRGGITPLNAQIRHSFEYKLWRDSVFKRDNWTCIWCGAHSGNGKRVILNADHIKPFAHFPELRFAIDNGRTLCVPCHETTDTYKGKMNNYHG